MRSRLTHTEGGKASSSIFVPCIFLFPHGRPRRRFAVCSQGTATRGAISQQVCPLPIGSIYWIALCFCPPGHSPLAGHHVRVPLCVCLSRHRLGVSLECRHDPHPRSRTRQDGGLSQGRARRRTSSSCPFQGSSDHHPCHKPCICPVHRVDRCGLSANILQPRGGHRQLEHLRRVGSLRVLQPARADDVSGRARNTCAQVQASRQAKR